MNNIAILVVLYDKELIDSKTLTSLVNFDFNFNSLVIYNNGPVNLAVNEQFVNSLYHKFKSVKIVNDLNNSPLSKIYSNFISEIEVSSYVILDDDTELNPSYIDMLNDNYLKPKYDIVVPKIISKGGEQYYPISNGSPVITEGDVNNLPNLLSITSGVVINNTLLAKINVLNNRVFDERYALYGVDTSFFKNISKNKRVSIGLASHLSHSLSRAESIDSPFRRKERLFDLAISTRCYPSLFNYYYFIKTLIKLFFSRNFKLALSVVDVFCKGRHPKC